MAVNRQKALQAAEKYVGKGKIDAAIKEYRKVLKDSPKDTGTLNRLGDLLARRGSMDEAIELFERTAQAYGDDGFFVKAIAIYKKILRLDTSRISVYESLAGLYQQQGLITESRSQYEAVASHYDGLGDSDGVVRAYERMAELDPGDPGPRAKLAELFMARNEVELALGQHSKIAEMMLEHGSVDQATSVLTHALQIAPDNLAFVTSAVLSLKESGHGAAARKVMEEAVRLNPQAARIEEVAGLTGDASRAETPAATADEQELTLADTPEVGLEAETVDAEAEPGFELLDPEAALDLPVVEPQLASPEVPAVGDLPDDLLVGDTILLDLEEDVSPDAVLEELDGVGTEEIGLVEMDLIEEDVEGADEPLAPEAPLPGDTVMLDLDGDLPSDDTLEVLGDVAAADADLDRSVSEPEAEQLFPAEPAGDTVLLDLEAVGSAESVLTELEDEVDVAPEEELVAAEEPATEEESVAEGLGDDPEDPDGHVGLLIEAENFIKYGLREKAIEKLNEVLEIDENNAMALGRLLELHLERNDRSQIAVLSRRLAVIYEERGNLEAWEVIQQSLAKAGYVFRSGELSFGRTTEAAPELVGGDTHEEAPDDLLPDQLFDDDDEQSEGDFFDLAAELVQELEYEDSSTVVEAESQTLEEIVQGFKQGVSESLSPEDYDTHFNLGIAYKEMGLLDEAVGEFELASKDDRYLTECASLLGACFVEKGQPDLGAEWYQKALSVSSLAEPVRLALLYELGETFESAAESDKARETFAEILELDSDYRDVAERLGVVTD